jgi:signal transduction histidine kinase
MGNGGLKNPIFLFYLLVFYVILQFLWWIYLIFSLNEQIYSESLVLKNKALMIVGEGSVFLLILTGGILMIRRAFKREMEVNEHQQNFLMSITHELKSPIASIKLFIQTLKSRDLDEAKRDEIYDQSLKEINRLNNLVGNLLLTQSIENKNYFLDKKVIAINDLIEEVVDNLKASALKQHSVQLDLLPFELNADKEAIQSVINNILENAAKYSPANTTINVQIRQSDSTTILSFKDEGQGISDDDKLRVFDKFKRIENEMTRRSKGTGLGLFIVKFIVDEHGGQIILKDNQPKGLNFEIHFKQ